MPYAGDSGGIVPQSHCGYDHFRSDLRMSKLCLTGTLPR